jgi:tetratricopeptide (TPR) repeat protein
MKTRATAWALTVLVLVPVALAPGCKSDEDNKWLGAGIGAVAGGLAGRAMGGQKNKAGGTIIGAVVGGVAGYAIAGGFGSDASEEEKKSPAFQQANSEFDAGVAAKKSGNDQAALQHYAAASQHSPDQPEPYNNAGLIYLEQGDKTHAELSFRRALAVDPKFEPARTNLQKMGLTP